MRILLISQFFPPDITAAAFRLADMVELLARQGHELQVLTAVPHKGRVEETEEHIPRGVEVRLSRQPSVVWPARCSASDRPWP